MSWRSLLVGLSLWMTPGLGYGEYRVFLLKISQRNADPQAGQDFRLVESTLDHLQYRFYYPVGANEEITAIDTWRCEGRTGDFKQFCPNPKGQIPAGEPPPP